VEHQRILSKANSQWLCTPEVFELLTNCLECLLPPGLSCAWRVEGAQSMCTRRRLLLSCVCVSEVLCRTRACITEVLRWT